MKKTIIIILILLFFSPRIGYPKPSKVDPQAKELCNQVMLEIFKEIYSLRGKYQELSQFDKDVMFKNKLGLYTIVYKYEEELEYPDGTIEVKVPYSFAVTIDRLQDQTFPSREGSFAYSFPVLSLKFSGYQNKRLLRTQFNVLTVLGKHGKVINDYQQQFLPVRLFIRTTKQEYKVDEPVDIAVILTNVSKANLVMKKLDSETLHFSLNGRIWGVFLESQNKRKNLSRREQIAQELKARREGRKKRAQQKNSKSIAGLLESGEAFTITFHGATFSDPQDVVVEAVYQIPMRGVYPSATVKFKVVEE